MIVEVGCLAVPARSPETWLFFIQLKNEASDFPSRIEDERGEVILKAQTVLYDSIPVPRNAEIVMNLVATGVLSPEFQFPESLYQHIGSIYPTWFSNLPEQVQSTVLPYLYNCNLAEQLKEVGKGWGWSPRVPLKAPSALETSAIRRYL